MTLLREYWPFLAALTIPAAQAAAAVHLLLKRRDARSSAAWMGLIWLTPVVGVVLYVFFGINRIKRRARTLRPAPAGYSDWMAAGGEGSASLTDHLGDGWRHMNRLVVLGDRLTERPLLSGCRIGLLVGGEKAYPAMLESIEGAETSITMASYIFDADRVGDRFRDALGRAVARGVEVRVLIDAVGARYSVPRMAPKLREVGVTVAHFMPLSLPWKTAFMNLRNHRKILVVDGRVAFTGGMNVREEFWPEAPDDYAARDLHFEIEGPVVCEIQEVFAEDWTFATGERLDGPRWFPVQSVVGDSLARGISDGPDVDYEKLQLTIIGALGAARSSVQIVTPYFLPDVQLISALNVAALRGVRVDVIVPAKNNLPVVGWAMMAQLEPLLERGVRIYESPPPFDHSKLMVVDACWVLLGSANLDPRSLQLNFEFNVEVFDAKLGARLNRFLIEHRDAASEVTLDRVRARGVPIKLRDGVCRLFSPYL